ncbi:MAG: hypothetical protein JWN74_3228 [Acidobacteriaceae bacterium]|nr:hypothetical protein [Acidobacteriaceae bacterium]
MSNIFVIDTSSHPRLVQEGESVSKPKLFREAEAISQLDRIAPKWRMHLYDGAIIDHILEVINHPRASRSEIGRRYRARRSASGLAGTSAFRETPSHARQRR